MQITITSEDENKLKQIEALAKKLGLTVSWKKKAGKKQPNNGAEMARLLEEIANTGVFDSIKDPVAWQREIRKDRPLPGRE